MMLFVCNTHSIKLARTACGDRYDAAHKPGRPGGHHSAESMKLCASCPIGKAHSDGDYPDTWPNGKPLVFVEVASPIAARAEPKVTIKQHDPVLPPIVLPEIQIPVKEPIEETRAARVDGEARTEIGQARERVVMSSSFMSTIVRVGDVEKTVAQWTKHHDLSLSTIHQRVKSGMSLVEACSKPKMSRMTKGQRARSGEAPPDDIRNARHFSSEELRELREQAGLPPTATRWEDIAPPAKKPKLSEFDGSVIASEVHTHAEHKPKRTIGFDFEVTKGGDVIDAVTGVPVHAPKRTIDDVLADHGIPTKPIENVAPTPDEILGSDNSPEAQAKLDKAMEIEPGGIFDAIFNARMSPYRALEALGFKVLAHDRVPAGYMIVLDWGRK